MKISPSLVEEIKRENVVLFLGAGASMGATDCAGNAMYGVSSLIEKLSDRFLGGEAKSFSLATVSELAMSEHDPIAVQIFIKKLFEDFEPADFHLKISLFRWKSIYSTNYDLIIEKAYSKVGDAPKKLVPIYSSTDRIDSLIATSSDLPYVKLHGCITKISETRSSINFNNRPIRVP
ncbi:SIR2 family protein [Marinomonas sp. TI.3.20]|uniref:SIR2 family protein n=1 Tax=Marinomonas sp. TI.3.20 TaxID=3121296 RepID=UPI00311EA2BD